MNEKDCVKIDYFVHEGEMARAERHMKRLWIALLVVIGLLFATNMYWLYTWSLYDYSGYEYQQDGEGVNLIGDTNKVDYVYGAETEGKGP